MRLQTVLSAAMLLALVGCTATDKRLTHGESGHPEYPQRFEYGSKIGTPRIEHIVRFNEGSSALTEEMRANLAPHVKRLIAKPWMSVNVQGNSSKPGSFDDNYQLGLERAIAVRDYLLTRGVDVSQIITSSIGEVHASGFQNQTVILSY